MRLSAMTCAIVLQGAIAATVFATSIPIVDVDPAADGWLTEPHSDGGVWGWTFFVKTPIVATHVGWYDEGGNGLSHSHRIGLWKDVTNQTQWPYFGNSSVQLLGLLNSSDGFGAFIPSGTAAELDGPWRKVPILGGPLTLQPGGYALGGVDNINSRDSIRYAGMAENAPIADGRSSRFLLSCVGHGNRPHAFRAADSGAQHRGASDVYFADRCDTPPNEALQLTRRPNGRFGVFSPQLLYFASSAHLRAGN